MLFVFNCKEFFIESKKKNGLIVQESDVLKLKLIKIAIKLNIKKSIPKIQVNLFLQIINVINIKITKTELLLIGKSQNCQISNFKTNIMESTTNEILVIILSKLVIT